MICKSCGNDSNNVRSLRSKRVFPFMRYYWWSEHGSYQAWERRRQRVINLLYSGRVEWCTCACTRAMKKRAVRSVTKVELPPAATAATFVTQGRPREYSSNAERQRAYRERQKQQRLSGQ